MSRRIALIYGPETPDGQVVVTSDYVVRVNDAVIAADASSINPLIITLPLAATRTLKSEVTVVKIDGNTGHPVSIIAQGSDTISGVTSINLTTQWSALTFEAAGAGRWLVTGGSDSGGGGGGVSDHGALTGLVDDDHTQYALADGTRGLFQGAEPDQFVSTSTNFATAGIKPGLVLYVGAGGDTLTLPSSDDYAGQSYLVVAGTGDITVAAASGETINGAPSYAVSEGNLVAFTAFTGGSWVTAQRAGSMFDLPDLATATLNDVVKYGAAGPEWVTGLDYEVTNATKEPIGHTDRSQSTISFNNSTRVFTIAPVSGTYEVWCSGVKYALTTQTVTLPNTTGLYYISFTAGVLGYATTYFVWDTETPTAYVYWNATTGKAEFLADERHGVTLDWATHEYLHRTRGASLANGFSLSGYTTSGTGANAADAQAGLAGGTFFDEDLEVQVVASATPTANTWEQNLAFPMQVPVFWLSGTSWQADTATTFPLKQGAGAARAQYNLLTGSTWSAAEAGNSDYVVSWIVATNNLNYPVIAILGQASYGSLNAARNVTWEELTLTNFPIFEFRPLHKLIFQTATSYSNAPSARLRDVQDIRGMSNIGSGTTTSDHGLLNGLADDDHTQYALADGTRGVTVATDPIFDAAGDLAVGSGADTAARLAKGNRTQSLVVGASTLEWDANHFNGSNFLTGTVTGAIAETLPGAQNFAAISATATGIAHVHGIYLPKGVTITTITFVSGATAAVSATNIWFALCDNTRTVLRVTSNDTTGGWGASTAKPLNLTSTFTTTYSGLHYLACAVTATTMPTFRGIAIGTATGINVNSFQSTTGLTTPVAEGTVLTKGANLNTVMGIVS